jgi:hypothetical protein
MGKEIIESESHSGSVRDRLQETATSWYLGYNVEQIINQGWPNPKTLLEYRAQAENLSFHIR